MLRKGVDDEKGVLLVDIGGGTGRDIVEFQRRYPDLSGRLIQQELPSVIEDSVNLPSE
jgi:hypothetical protein